MTKVNNAKLAATIAKENGESYGLCVFDGKYYTGTVAQLQNIGCIIESNSPAIPDSCSQGVAK